MQPWERVLVPFGYSGLHCGTPGGVALEEGRGSGVSVALVSGHGFWVMRRAGFWVRFTEVRAQEECSGLSQMPN